LGRAGRRAGLPGDCAVVESAAGHAGATRASLPAGEHAGFPPELEYGSAQELLARRCLAMYGARLDARHAWPHGGRPRRDSRVDRAERLGLRKREAAHTEFRLSKLK